jgi:asparagine synthase (glutamine-hydrolysing)
MLNDLFHEVVPTILNQEDLNYMDNSVENRCPFLDKRIIEFGFSLPSEYKIKVLEQKFILRKLAAKRGLVNALDMEKKGLIVVFNKWENKEDWNRSYYFDFLKSNSSSITNFVTK